MFCNPKILKNESNSQLFFRLTNFGNSCFVSQRYWKMKAIHNKLMRDRLILNVVLYPKDTEKWKQFTTDFVIYFKIILLFCIPKILKNESNSQLISGIPIKTICCFVSQRYWKMKAIHNNYERRRYFNKVVLYPKDTEKWKQFTTQQHLLVKMPALFCIPKILKNESNSQRVSTEHN